MARYFRDISIYINSNEKLLCNKSIRDFNITTHTVQNIFWYMIPSRFEFGNILKLNIEINGEDSKYDEPTDFDGYVTYSYIGFNFQEYFNLTRKGQNERILNVLKEIVQKIPVENEENKKIALSIINEIKKMNFDYKHISKRLSKFHKSRKYKANIVYNVNDDGQNSYISIVDKEGNELVNEFLLKNNLYEFNHCLNKTRWEDNVFQIMTKDGKLFKEYRINTEANNS